jgi:lipopolysaccharide transport system permease protein
LGGQSTIYLPGFAVSLAMVLFFLWLGVRKFRSMEKSFADII